jgi:hypothetical protein
MKRMFILVAIVSLVAGSLFADEAILIDFSKLAANIHVAASESETETDTPNQNRETMMDYQNVAGGSFTDAQKQFLKTSLAPANWVVTLASSAQTVENQVASYAKEALSQRELGGEGAEPTPVMGVRVHFPVEPHNSWAIIKPPFPIPGFERRATVGDDGAIGEPEAENNNGITTPSRFEAPVGDDGKVDPNQPAYGLVKNVGTIKSVAARVYGLNYPHHLSAILVDAEGVEKVIDLGYLNHDGWGEHVWNNPGYITEVRNRDLRLFPLYPVSTPMVKFGGFLVQRDAANVGGDFVAYFKDVKIVYDKATLENDRDIDDESTWGLIKEREADKDKNSIQKFGQNQILQYLEKSKQATELNFGVPGRNANNE